MAAIALWTRFSTRLPATFLPSAPAPVTTSVVPVDKAPLPAPVTVKPPTVAITPYLPTVRPTVEPVTYPPYTYGPGYKAITPVVAPEPAPLVPHIFKTCATCGEEKVTAPAPTPVAEVAPPAPTPATPAPTPAPATPTTKAKASGWLVALAVVLLLSGGLALASAVRPHK